jgi:hypothetical protein
MNKDVKGRIQASFEQGNVKAPRLSYELSVDGTRAQKKVNGGAYLKASAGSEIEIDTSNVSQGRTSAVVLPDKMLRVVHTSRRFLSGCMRPRLPSPALLRRAPSPARGGGRGIALNRRDVGATRRLFSVTSVVKSFLGCVR